MSNPRPPNAKESSSKLPASTSSSIPSSTFTKKRSNPFDQDEATFTQPSSSPPPPPPSKAQSTAATSSTATLQPSPFKASSADGTNELKTSPSSRREWKPKDEAPSREKALCRLVSNPSHPLNPITSRTGQNAIDVIVSASTGHQARSYGPNSRTAAEYFQVRQEKLKEQAAGKKDEIFKGVRVWLDGWLGVGVTNLEIKSLVNSHGGTVSEYPGKHVTHILAHQPLSASKNHSFLTKHKGWKPQIVDPQWVDECVQKGKRVDVFKFLILSPCDQPRVASFFGSVKSQQEPDAKRPKLVASKLTSTPSTSTSTFSSSSSIGPRSRSAPSVRGTSSISSSFSKSTAVKGHSWEEAIEID
ncbi:hypothetical protein BDY24DRAFT_413381 [Mrakia frigida]|uniref:uncharacterized protein n=1 Tax=Mrakia frigida TaxID=29902 RepID=UPI003FCC0488